MPAIEPAPENPETAENLDTPVGLAVVDAVISELSRGAGHKQSREDWHKQIAKSVGVTVYVVATIDANRKWWAKNPPKPSKQREAAASKGKTRGRKGIAPEGSKVVPAYRCGDHRSIYLPCQICISRNRAK